MKHKTHIKLACAMLHELHVSSAHAFRANLCL